MNTKAEHNSNVMVCVGETATQLKLTFQGKRLLVP